jgi:peptide-methionine (R)-S-oxide reductase
MKVTKRDFLATFASAAAATLAALGGAWAKTIQKLELSEAEWRKRLSLEAFDILRKEGTERPYSSPLNKEKRNGTYHCAGCDLALFSSDAKYESGTGWPSFYKVIAGHVETRKDYGFGMVRTEYHCARCGGHQGHVFDDGPQPTGLRYCNNGLALQFKPRMS